MRFMLFSHIFGMILATSVTPWLSKVKNYTSKLWWVFTRPLLVKTVISHCRHGFARLLAKLQIAKKGLLIS